MRNPLSPKKKKKKTRMFVILYEVFVSLILYIYFIITCAVKVEITSHHLIIIYKYIKGMQIIKILFITFLHNII